MEWIIAAVTGFKLYEQLKGRNNHAKVYNTPCNGVSTNCFIKGNQWMGKGRISGQCGTRKDHSRVFMCHNCYKIKFQRRH